MTAVGSNRRLSDSRETGAVPLRRNPDYLRLLTGRTAALVGAAMSNLPLMMLALDLTHSASQAATIAATSLLGTLVSSLPAGVMADRIDRRRLLVAASLVVAVVTATIPCAMRWGKVTYFHLLVVALVSGICDTCYAPAATAALRRLVEPSQLGKAVNINQIRGAVADTIGPLLGAALYEVNRIVPFVVDASTSLISGLLACRIRTPLGPDRAVPDMEEGQRTRGGAWSDVREGLSYLASRRPLVVSGTMSCLLNTSTALVGTVVMLDLQARGGALSVGFLSTVMGVVAMSGAVLAGPLMRRISLGRIVLLLPAMSAGLNTYLVSQTHDAMQGCTSSALRMLSMVLMPLAQVLGGVLLEAAGRAAAIGAGVMIVAIVLGLWATSPQIRSMPRAADLEPVDGQPNPVLSLAAHGVVDSGWGPRGR